MTEHVAGDALLAAVLRVCRHHGVERSRESLLAPLGATSPLSVPLACRVLQEAGMRVARVEREPADILALLLPAILLLKDGQAAVLLGREVADGATRFRLWLPQAGVEGTERTFDATEMSAHYAGEALLVSPEPAASAVSGGSAQAADAAEALGGHWFWRTLRRYVPYYRGAMLAALLSNVLMLLIGLFTSVVYDRVIPHQAMVTLWTLGIGAFVAIAFDMTARQLRAHLIDHAGKKADLALGSVLFRQSLSLRLEHRPDSSGSFAHHMAQLEIVREFSTSATMSALSDLPFIALFIAAIWLMAGPLALVPLVAVPVLLLLTVGVQQWLRRSMTAQQHRLADMQGLLVEAVDGIETIRACGAQGHFQRQYDHANALAAQAALQSRMLSSWIGNITMIAQQLLTVVMLIWGVHLIRDNQITGGALISAVMFAGRAVAPLGSVVALASRYQGARAALRMLDRLMALPTERDADRRYLPLPAVQGGLSLREAGFGYGSGPQTPQVVKGVSVQIRPGERVAILGRIGSGKSTVLRLLAGLYQPTQGAVELDGIDLRQIDPADFRRQIGFVEQEPHLFRGSLRDNLLLGRDVAPDALAEVLRLTGLDRIAAQHPLGLDLPVGEGGALLSGGQRQLVALARALALRPKIVLMDEPSSAMDAQTEQVFVQQLRALLPGRTLVVVTHRPALLDLVDRILVVDGGRLLADGPKQAVLQALSGAPVRPPATAPAPAPAPTVPAAVPAATDPEAATPVC